MGGLRHYAVAFFRAGYTFAHFVDDACEIRSEDVGVRHGEAREVPWKWSVNLSTMAYDITEIHTGSSNQQDSKMAVNID